MKSDEQREKFISEIRKMTKALSHANELYQAVLELANNWKSAADGLVSVSIQGTGPRGSGAPFDYVEREPDPEDIAPLLPATESPAPYPSEEASAATLLALKAMRSGRGRRSRRRKRGRK